MIILSIKKEYNQQPDETLTEWKYRLLIGKARKQIKLSWTQIRDLLMLDCTTDHIRHHAYGALGYESFIQEAAAYQENNIDTDAEAAELAAKREKIRMQDQKRELNKLLREWARAEHIDEEVKKAAQAAAKIKPLQAAKPIQFSGGREAILILSDWHYGQKSANCCNTFNDAVFRQRIETLLSRTKEYCKRHEVQRLHVFALGDLVNGLIHVTTRINNTEDVIKQTMTVAEVLSDMLNNFSKTMKVDAYFSRGNHDRVSANKKESIAAESFFDVLPWYVRARIGDDQNIEIHNNTVDEEIVTAQIAGCNVFAVHGHKDRPGKAVQNLSLMLRQFPDLVLLGHFHAAAEQDVQGADVVVNGSLCGTDDYAMQLRRTSKPAQKLLIMGDGGGRECTYNINL